MSGMKANARCQSCLQPIRWAKTAAGRSMPLDPVPVYDGNVVVETWRGDNPTVIVFSKPEDVPASEPLRYKSHFVTCPDAARFRKDRP